MPGAKLVRRRARNTRQQHHQIVCMCKSTLNTQPRSETKNLFKRFVFRVHMIGSSCARWNSWPRTCGSSKTKCEIQKVGWGGGRAYSFVACLSHLATDHAPLSRRSTGPTPNRDTSNIWALITFFPSVVYSVVDFFCLGYTLPVSPSVATIHLLE